MANLREILVDWTTASGGGKVSVLNFEQSIAVATQRTALQTFLTSLMGALDNSVTYRIQPSGREFDDATGTLTGAWTESSVKTGVGAGTGEPVADATMLLLQWKTSSIVNGRFLQGRTYIPGMFAGNLSNGNVASGTITGLQTAINTFIASAAGLVVWHRPTSGGSGSHTAVSTGSVWPELAVLRRRRG